MSFIYRCWLVRIDVSPTYDTNKLLELDIKFLQNLVSSGQVVLQWHRRECPAKQCCSWSQCRPWCSDWRTWGPEGCSYQKLSAGTWTQTDKCCLFWSVWGGWRRLFSQWFPCVGSHHKFHGLHHSQWHLLWLHILKIKVYLSKIKLQIRIITKF